MDHATISENKLPVSLPSMTPDAFVDRSSILANFLGVTEPEFQSRPWDAPTMVRTLGPHLSVWKNLAEESNPQLFAQDLYHLGQSYERLGHFEIPKRIYTWLERNEAVAPAVAKLARERSALLAGEGPWSHQLESFFRYGVAEVSAPDLLLAMGAAGMGYGLGRVLGRSAASVMGFGETTTRYFGGGLAMGTEVTTFTLTQQSAACLIHGDPWPHKKEFGHHWLSAAMMIGILRGSHALVPSRHLIRSRVSEQVVLQGTQYAGLWSNAYLRQLLGWDPVTTLAEVWAQALGQWATFHVAGRLGRDLFAPVLGNRGEMSEPKAQHRQGASQSVGLVWAVPHGVDLGPIGFAMKGKVQSTSDIPRGRIIKSFSSAQAATTFSSQAFNRSETLIQWVRTMMDHKPQFRERLVLEDIQVQLESKFGWNPRILGEILNELPSFEAIPQGRKIRFQVPGQDKSQAWVKNGASFEHLQAASPSPVLARVEAGRNTKNPAAAHEITVATHPTSLLFSENPLSLNQLWLAEHLPLMIHGLEQLSVHLKRMPTMGQTGQRPQIILVDRALTLESLRQATPHGREGMAEGQSWNLLVPRNDVLHRVFIGQIKNERVTWRLGESRDWERVSRQALFERPVVRSPLEVFQLIDAISRDPSRLPDTNAVIKHRGALSFAYLQGLDAMIMAQLRHPSPGNRISIVNESELKVLEYHRDNGYWMREFRAGPEQLSSEPKACPTPVPSAQKVLPSSVESRSLRQSVLEFRAATISEPTFQVARIPTDLLQQMRAWSNGPRAKNPLEILLRFNRALNLRDEARIQQRLAGSHPQGTLILHDTQGRKSVKFSPKATGVLIEKDAWIKPRSFDPLWVGSPLELLKNIALIQGHSFSPAEILQVKVRGPWQPGEIPPSFLNGLNSYRLLPFSQVEILWPLSARRKTLERSSTRVWQARL